jgi:hypothetical protein
MEDIMNKMDKIGTILDIMDDDTRMNFHNSMNDQIKRMNDIICEMEKKISEIELSDKEREKLNLDMRRHKLICKYLFPYFWILNDFFQSYQNNKL